MVRAGLAYKLGANSVLRAGYGTYFDTIGAKAAGMRAGFVNRRHRPSEDTPYQPDLVVHDFTELADALA